ncbi:sulfite exporter TauE/SafE family protein [Pontiella agarivorans]|uniref:Sulfite exporter TauE/SafE family protein n=1 Tax=Pontiella agarivorans TaxID=3038953 RepID=A0ABU5MZ17_9BACT|nr:sulfite exporter TauE/SafE family protein [Pontiella agarivorans]MDZ8119455.1 sulfite exporter TauE/SafE family protein [Pontiella agarivorans]
MEQLIAAIILGAGIGFTAIPHCYAMCGPLHVSVCALHRENSLKALSLFNLGRIAGYTLAGILFGAFGEFINIGPAHFCCQVGLNPVRGALLSLLFPGVIMFFIAFYAFRRKGLKAPKSNWLSRFFSGGLGKLTVGGACTSLIPCGMLYAAFAMAVGQGSWWKGGAFMLAFVVTQTFFMQLGVSLGRLVDKKWGARFEKAFPWICLMIGIVYCVLFVLRISPAENG